MALSETSPYFIEWIPIHSLILRLVARLLFPRFEMCTQSCHSLIPLAALCAFGISTPPCTLKMNTWTIEPAEHQQVSVVALNALYQHEGISIELKAQQWCPWSMHGCKLSVQTFTGVLSGIITRLLSGLWSSVNDILQPFSCCRTPSSSKVLRLWSSLLSGAFKCFSSIIYYSESPNSLVVL